MQWIWFVLAGIMGGFFGGMGMGGGTLLIPILSIFLGVEQKLCQGLNLMSFLVMAIISILIHHKNGLLKIRNTQIIIIFGVIFAIFGSVLMTFLPSKILKFCFGIFLCLLSAFEFVKVFKK